MTLSIENKRQALQAQSPQRAFAELIKEFSGVQHTHFLEALLSDFLASFRDIKDSKGRFDATVAALKELQPRDAYELMLCIQIVSGVIKSGANLPLQ